MDEALSQLVDGSSVAEAGFLVSEAAAVVKACRGALSDRELALSAAAQALVEAEAVLASRSADLLRVCGVEPRPLYR